MTDVYFLAAREPLVKSFKLVDGEIEKQQYPAVKHFTSFVERCTSPAEFCKALKDHAAKGHCLIKGKLKRIISDEPRAGLTETNDTTEWMCLDLDKAPFKTPAELMDAHPLLKDVSYIVQYSASQGLPNAKGLSCHIYIMLSHSYHAPYLKAWLMQQNLDGSILAGVIRKAIKLTETSNYLHYPIDITACQNDKLLYIAPPVVDKQIKYSVDADSAIQLVVKQLSKLPIERLKCDKIEVYKKQATELLNALREEASLAPIARRTKIIGGFEVQTGVGEIAITGINKARGFTYFNFNHGDSWAYYHPDENFEYIHNFKGEPVYKTSEIMPDYYKQCKQEHFAETTTPTEHGDLVLAVCNKRSGSYHKVIWNEAEQQLAVYPALSKDQLHDWLKSYNKTKPEFIDQYDIEFNPQVKTILDHKKKYLNLYIPNAWFKRTVTKRSIDECPTIKRVLMSVASRNEWTKVTEHLLNWLAVIFQHRIKTTTAWVFSGVEGTGKGTFINHIVAPLLGREYVRAMDMSVLEDTYNEYLERALILSLDEVQLSALNGKGKIASRLRNWITEPTVNLRKMRASPYDTPSFVNLILSSNKDDPIIINNQDRRYNIAEFQTEKLNLTYTDVFETIPTELPYFFDYIMTRPADIQQAAQIIHTNTRKAVINANRNSIDVLSDALLNGDINPFVSALPDMRLISEVHATGNKSAIAVQFNAIVTREVEKIAAVEPDKNGFHRLDSTLTRDELWVLFEHAVGNIPNSPHRFTKLLRHKHIETQRMRVNGKLVYGFNVRWLASHDWLQEHTIEMPAKITPLKTIKGGSKL